MTARDFEAENAALRARLAQLEGALSSGTDPLGRALLQNAPDFLNVFSPEGRMVATGRSSEAYGSVVGRSLYEFTAPESHETLRGAIARACETGQPVSAEVTGFSPSGEPGHVFLSRLVPLLENGEVTALVMVPTDITERVALERSLRESKAALQTAVEAGRLGFWRWDVATDHIDWDQRVLDIYRLDTPPADLPAYLLRAIHPDDRAHVESVIRQTLETGAYPTFEHRIASGRDGGERWVLAAGTLLKNESGNPTSLTGIVIDITEQKQFRTQMERASRVEAIGQLSAGLSHNFNNLLGIIIPSLERAIAHPGAASLSAALEAALQAREVVRGVLELSRPRSEGPREVVTPDDVVRRVEGIARSTLPREIELTCTLAPHVEAVAMRPAELEQVLLNLLFNARDALVRSSGERRIHVSVDQVGAENGQAVRIRVADSGAGMTDEVRRRAFEPFFTTKPPHWGSGLGLAHSLTVVTDAGGTLECTSAPGKGTVMTILLPSAPRPSPAAARLKESAAGGEGGTILLVDDEPRLRRLIRQILEARGYTVVEAESAADARQALEKTVRLDLVILDQSMPRESGLEALPSLRARTKAPIVLFTGLAPDAVPADIASILEKPVRTEELLTLVRKTIGESRAKD